MHVLKVNSSKLQQCITKP